MRYSLLAMLSFLSLISCLAAFADLAPPPSFDPSIARAAVQAILGTYRGHWDSFGIDPSGQIVKKVAWDDVITLSGPVTVESNRAYGQVTDVMSFVGGGSRTVSFIEGFQLNPDGTPASRFFEFGGATTLENKVASGTWAFDAPLGPWDFQSLGLRPEDVVTVRSASSATPSKAWAPKFRQLQANGFGARTPVTLPCWFR